MKTLQPKNDKQDRELRMRARIRQAAFMLMAERGIDKVSMREIAGQVQVTKPVLYYYFKNKEDLCQNIIEERIGAFNELVDEAYRKGLSVQELMRVAFEAHFNFFEKDPVNSKFIIRMISYTLDHQEQAPKDGPHGEEKLEQFLSSAEEKGELAKNAGADVLRLMGAVFVQMMLSAYMQQNVSANKKNCARFAYNKEALGRMAQIILLGVNQYYKG